MPASIPITDRMQLAGRLRAARQAVSESVTTEFLERHPDCISRYGDRARTLGIEDACFHLDFLAGAIESGSPQSFEEYSRWAARMLDSRGIKPQFLAENLQQIGRAVADRFPESGALVEPYVEAGCSACVGPLSDPADDRPEDELQVIQRAFLQAILQGQRRAAANVLIEAVRNKHAIPDLYDRVVQESLCEIGGLWQTNRITVAQEHMATAIAQYAIAQVYPLIPWAAQSQGKAVITGVEGEHHQVGSNLVSDALEAEGWDVVFLGANTPTSSILETVKTQRPDVLGVSLTMLFNVPVLVRLVENLRRLGQSAKIVAGGAAVGSAAALCDEIGLDGTAASVKSAIQLFHSLRPNHSGGPNGTPAHV